MDSESFNFGIGLISNTFKLQKQSVVESVADYLTTRLGSEVAKYLS